MKLYYRGISYDLTPPVETPPTEISGTYRGKSWQFRQGDPSRSFWECEHCHFYSGNPHLVCAVHPQGSTTPGCPDFRLNDSINCFNQPDLTSSPLSKN
jgi:hypothetical protein